MSLISCFTLEPVETAKKAVADGLQLPKVAPNGHIHTLNNCGSMKLGEFFAVTTHKFIELAVQPGMKVLDIGAAYGETCLECIRRGALDYTINDLEEKHVKIAARRIYENFPEKISSIKLIVGNISDHALDSILEENSYNGILADSILHFLEPKSIFQAIQQFYRCLKSGGKVFALMCSYYHSTIRKEIRDEFDRRTQAFIEHSNSDDSDIPGYMENTYDMMDFDQFDKEDFKKKFGLQGGKFLAFNRETTTYLFQKAGFIIEECTYTEIPVYPIRLDGRERVAMIARKP